VPARDAVAHAVEEARLYAEAARLTETFAADVAASDEAATDLARARAAILATIASLGMPGQPAAGDAPLMQQARAASREALERIRELDGPIMTRLKIRAAAMRKELESLRGARETLRGYRGASRPSPRYLDRLG
jgi:hypothetical protein